MPLDMGMLAELEGDNTEQTERLREAQTLCAVHGDPVTLLRDSRGTVYLKVQGRRLPVDDPQLQCRLQRALRAAFLAPSVYGPRAPVHAGAEEWRVPSSLGGDRTEPSLSNTRAGRSRCGRRAAAAG